MREINYSVDSPTGNCLTQCIVYGDKKVGSGKCCDCEFYIVSLESRLFCNFPTRINNRQHLIETLIKQGRFTQEELDKYYEELD